jgi:hypothetical protein
MAGKWKARLAERLEVVADAARIIAAANQGHNQK